MSCIMSQEPFQVIYLIEKSKELIAILAEAFKH